MSLVARHALSIGIAGFDRHERLDYAPKLAGDLQLALTDIGYDAHAVTRDTLPGGELGALVTKQLNEASVDDLVVVHLISHGERSDGGATVFAMGSDSERHADASIAHWLTMQQSDERPLALFLLDLCAGGVSARLPWQVQTEKPMRGWVIAACGAEESAYDGRFTEAVITVLKALRLGELDIDPSMSHVPLSTVARAIRQEVNRLATAADAFPQQVTASLVDISADVDPPFFPNPAYHPAPRPRLRAAVDPGVLPFLDDLDEGLDARHFLERAIGLGRLTDVSSGLVGCFTGRDQQLKQISPWLNGLGAQPLCVVTGSPGSGKSALLGVLVCAASPMLRDATEPVWHHVAQAPLPVRHLAAVHARQRGLATVVASIARQLGLPEGAEVTELVTTLRERPTRPVLVIDALDEADDPEGLMQDLMLPLVDTEAPGSPVRLLVGVRRYDVYEPLFEQAWLHDLDDVRQAVLENNLYDYVGRLLRTTDEYRSRGAVTGAFAQAVASTLAEPDAHGKRRWGPFLVAGLYVRHFILTHADNPVSDPDLADELGRRVPSHLHGVLELDLELERDQPWLRPVMTTLAYACGAGMPVSVLARVAPVFAPNRRPPSTAQIRTVLAIAKFYLRQSMDTDRSNVYRLFHQGLADTLAAESSTVASAVLDAMLSSLGPADNRDWDAAEPYLFRHIASHAKDAGRTAEIETDPGLLLHPDSSLAFTEAAGDSQAAESVASNARRFAGIRTPAGLALAAARAGEPELARRAANMAGRAPLLWQPRWTAGTAEPPQVVTEQPEPVDTFQSIALSDDGTTLVAVNGTGLVTWRWRVGEAPVIESRSRDLTAYIVALSPDGSETMVGQPGVLVAHSGEVRAMFNKTTVPRVKAAVYAGPFRYVCASVNGEVAEYDLANETQDLLQRSNHRGGSWAVGWSESYGAVAASTNGTLVVLFRSGWGLRHEYRLDEAVTAVAVSRTGSYVAAGTAGGSLRVAPILDEPAPWEHTASVAAPVTSLSFSPNSAALVAGCRDGSVYLYWPTSGVVTQLEPRTSLPITAVAVSEAMNRVVSLDSDGVLHFHDLTSAARGRLDRQPTVLSEQEDAAVTAFHPADSAVLIGLADGRVESRWVESGRVYNTAQLRSPARDFLTMSIGGATTVAVAAEHGHLLYSGDFLDGFLELGDERWIADQFGQVPSALLMVDGRLVHLAHNGGKLLIRAVDQGTPMELPLGVHPGCQVLHCAYVRGAATVFTGSTDGSVRVWDAGKRELLDTYDVGRPVWKIATVGGEHLLVGAGGELVMFDHVSRRGK